MSESKSGLGRILRAAAARVPEPRTAHRFLNRLTHPLRMDDYSSLIYPLWSSRELRGEVVSVRREADDAVTLVIKPGWGATPTYRRCVGRRALDLAFVLADLGPDGGPG